MKTMASLASTEAARINTPGTRVGPCFRDQTMAINSRKNARTLVFRCREKREKSVKTMASLASTSNHYILQGLGLV